MTNEGDLCPLIQPSASQGSVDPTSHLIPTQSQRLGHENDEQGGIAPR